MEHCVDALENERQTRDARDDRTAVDEQLRASIVTVSHHPRRSVVKEIAPLGVRRAAVNMQVAAVKTKSHAA
jgi:hypothetical protein